MLLPLWSFLHTSLSLLLSFPSISSFPLSFRLFSSASHDFLLLVVYLLPSLASLLVLLSNFSLFHSFIPFFPFSPPFPIFLSPLPVAFFVPLPCHFLPHSLLSFLLKNVLGVWAKSFP